MTVRRGEADLRLQFFKKSIAGTSPRTAALVVGIAFFVSLIIVTLVDDVILANFVIPGDTSALARDIEADPRILLFASIGYLAVLVLDATIGLALYVVLKPASKRLAMLVGTLRILYAGTLTVGVLALLLQIVDVNGYASIKLLGYIFFAAHILALGYVVLVSEYIPKSLGAWLVVASLSYVVFFIDVRLPEWIAVLTMLTMAGAEIALSIWLAVKRNSLPR